MNQFFAAINSLCCKTSKGGFGSARWSLLLCSVFRLPTVIPQFVFDWNTLASVARTGQPLPIYQSSGTVGSECKKSNGKYMSLKIYS
jgi:hypothetical protein